jgi:hypothetical protein
MLIPGYMSILFAFAVNNYLEILEFVSGWRVEEV